MLEITSDYITCSECKLLTNVDCGAFHCVGIHCVGVTDKLGRHIFICDTCENNAWGFARGGV